MAFISAGNGSRQPMFLVVTGILILLSITVVSLRLYCRYVYIRYVGLDDYFMVAALAVAIGMTVMNVFHVSWGTGQHTTDLDLLAILVPTLKHWYAYQMVYPWALFFVKASILALYHRIFTQTNFRRAVYAVTVFVSMYTIIVFFVNAFECPGNTSQAWSPTFPQGCNNLPATYFSTASINILTDIVILVMPFRAFSQLNLHQRKRWALIGIFMVGGVAVIASIVRLYALWVYTVTKDVAYDAIFILLLSQIEVNLAVISASAPSLRPLFNKGFLGSSYGPSYGAYGGSRTYGPQSGSNMFPRSHRAKKAGVIELHSFNAEAGPKQPSAVHVPNNMDNTSEEYILGGDDGITKTVETRVQFDQYYDDGARKR